MTAITKKRKTQSVKIARASKRDGKFGVAHLTKQNTILVKKLMKPSFLKTAFGVAAVRKRTLARGNHFGKYHKLIDERKLKFGVMTSQLENYNNQLVL